MSSRLARWTGPVNPGPFRFRRDGDGDGREVTIYLPDNSRGDFTPSRGVVVYRPGERPEEADHG